MTKPNLKEDKTEVLYAFQLACENPTAEDIIEWTERHPEFADAIRQRAETLLAQRQRARFERLEPDEDMLARGRSAAMNAIYEAESEAEQRANDQADDRTSSGTSGGTSDFSSSVDFDRLIDNAGQSIPTLARKLVIDRFVIAELAAGRMNLPVGDRFLSALVNILERAADTIVAAIRQSLQQPRLGQAKARDRPSFEACSYEEVVTGSDDMTPEQKDYWLDKPSSWTPGAKLD